MNKIKRTALITLWGIKYIFTGVFIAILNFATAQNVDYGIINVLGIADGIAKVKILKVNEHKQTKTNTDYGPDNEKIKSTTFYYENKIQCEVLEQQGLTLNNRQEFLFSRVSDSYISYYIIHSGLEFLLKKHDTICFIFSQVPTENQNYKFILLRAEKNYNDIKKLYQATLMLNKYLNNELNTSLQEQLRYGSQYSYTDYCFYNLNGEREVLIYFSKLKLLFTQRNSNYLVHCPIDIDGLYYNSELNIFELHNGNSVIKMDVTNLEIRE